MASASVQASLHNSFKVDLWSAVPEQAAVIVRSRAVPEELLCNFFLILAGDPVDMSNLHQRECFGSNHGHRLKVLGYVVSVWRGPRLL